jgi:hypothetical protein
LMEQFSQVARCRAHFAAVGDGAESVAAESHARRSLEMLVQTAARRCRSRAAVRRASDAQGEFKEAKRTKLTVLGHVQRRWKTAAGVVGRRVDVVGRGERSAVTARQERDVRAHAVMGARGWIGDS